MKLISLDPRWLMKDGVRKGFVFRTPVPNPKKVRFWQSCFFEPTPHAEQRKMFDDALPETGASQVQGCNAACGWTLTGTPEDASFDTITITPSLDGSAGGLWHGYITAGEIVGGW
jgi:hypothetical protein